MGSTKIRSVPFDLTTATVSLANSGDLVAAISGKKIIVWRLSLSISDPTKTIKLQSGGTTDLTGAMLLDAANLEALPIGSQSGDVLAIPVCETAAGEKLNIVASAAVDIAGWIVYSTATE